MFSGSLVARFCVLEGVGDCASFYCAHYSASVCKRS